MIKRAEKGGRCLSFLYFIVRLVSLVDNVVPIAFNPTSRSPRNKFRTTYLFKVYV